MSFDITGGTEEVWSCNNCSYCSTKRHFSSSEGSLLCPLCNNDAQKISEIEPSVGISDFKYRQLLSQLNEAADGVGSKTVENIEQHFEDGDDFLNASEAAYQEMDYDPLRAVDGIGKASAKEIALTIAESEGWENGALFVL